MLNITFEEALKELTVILEKMNSGQDTLEKSIAAFERACVLQNYCKKQLEDARLRVQKVIEANDGKITLENLQK